MSQTSKPETKVLIQIRDEVVRQVEQQQVRLHSARQSAVLWSSIFLAAIILILTQSWVVGAESNSNSDDVLQKWLLYTTIVLLIIGIVLALMVDQARKWRAGPEGHNMLKSSYIKGNNLRDFEYRFIKTHLINLRVNEQILVQQTKCLSFMISSYICSLLYASTRIILRELNIEAGIDGWQPYVIIFVPLVAVAVPLLIAAAFVYRWDNELDKKLEVVECCCLFKSTIVEKVDKYYHSLYKDSCHKCLC